jgi:hypothetical protein
VTPEAFFLWTRRMFLMTITLALTSDLERRLKQATEQQETGEYLIRVLDEDRLSERKLFPPELKGVTW